MKRFTETSKWDDPWFRSLTGPQKLVFLYIIDRCNNAGFWERDEESLIFHTRLDQKHISGAIEGLNRGLIERDGWFWVKRFLRHQKNENLNPGNNAHLQIIALLKEQAERFNGVPEFDAFLGAVQGLTSPTGKVKVKDSPGRRRVQGGTTEGFDQFWQSYPRKVGKGDAEDAWKKHECDSLLPIILSAVSSARNSSDWSKDGGQYIPHPATWLNRRGWEDQLAPPSITNGSGSRPIRSASDAYGNGA